MIRWLQAQWVGEEPQLAVRRCRLSWHLVASAVRFAVVASAVVAAVARRASSSSAARVWAERCFASAGSDGTVAFKHDSYFVTNWSQSGGSSGVPVPASLPEQAKI